MALVGCVPLSAKLLKICGQRGGFLQLVAYNSSLTITFMAEKRTALGPEAIIKDIKARNFSPVYVLMGEESYYIDRIANLLEETVLQPHERDFNQDILFGVDTSGVQVADLCKAYPMMAERRLVVVKEAQGMKQPDALARYLEHPVQTTILVLCHKNGTIDRRKKLLARAEAIGVVFESKKKRDYELPAFIKGYLSTKKATVDDKAAIMIAEHIGSDLNRMTSELDKVLISLPQNDLRITPDIVERQIGVSKEFNGFELRNAIVNRDVFKANQIIQYFDKNPKAGSIFAFLPLLFSYFQNLLIAYYAPNKNNEAEVAKFLELKSVWGVKDFMMGMRNYSAMKAMHIIHKIREIDAKSKGLDNPNTPVGDLMKELIFFILH